jgi:hypothetical protein
VKGPVKTGTIEKLLEGDVIAFVKILKRIVVYSFFLNN